MSGCSEGGRCVSRLAECLEASEGRRSISRAHPLHKPLNTTGTHSRIFKHICFRKTRDLELIKNRCVIHVAMVTIKHISAQNCVARENRQTYKQLCACLECSIYLCSCRLNNVTNAQSEGVTSSDCLLYDFFISGGSMN